MRRGRVIKDQQGLDVAGACSLSAILSIALCILPAMAAPISNACADTEQNQPSIHLDKKFKGNLPITELTED